jgi:alpha-glucosidase (family GH31 glycosyl hydrolase)
VPSLCRHLSARAAAGSSLLVAPVLDQGASEVQVVLPGGGLWYDNIDGTVIDSAVPAHRNFR